MKWKFSLSVSPMPVYYFAKLLGLAPFTVKNNRFYAPTLLGKLYPILVATSYSLFKAVLFNSMFEKIYQTNMSLLVKSWATVQYLMGPTTLFFTVIKFLLLHKKIVHLMNKLCTVSNELKSLGIEEDHEIFFKRLFMTTLLANAVLVATYSTLLAIEPSSYISSALQFCCDNWFSLNTILIYAQILTCIRQRFTLVNGKLYDLLIPTDHLRPSCHVRLFVINGNTREENQPGREGLTVCERIRKIRTLHSEFCNLVDQTTHLLASSVLLNGLRVSTQLVLSSYWMYSVVTNSSPFMLAEMSYSALKMFVVIGQLFIIACASARICQQGNATRAVLFKVWVKFNSRELTNEFLKFSRQLLHIPVVVSAFGFVDLGYSFIFKIFCIFVTYLIVMIQFEATRPYTT